METNVHETYQSVLSGRYASKQMQTLFSDEHRIARWRKLWIWLAQAEMELGLPMIHPEQIDDMQAHINDIDWSMIKTFEKQLRHDVMAHVHAFELAAPKAKGIVHLGATSAYVQDNADILIMRDGLQLILEKTATCLHVLSNFAILHKSLPTIGRTHYQPASLTTVGKRAVQWAQDLLIAFQHVNFSKSSLLFRGAKGATGTQNSFLTLFGNDINKVRKLDRRICELAGFFDSETEKGYFTITGQTYSRMQDCSVICSLAMLGAAVHKICMDIRMLQCFDELMEPFESSQVGSSAMPYKRNPMRSERCCGLARFLINMPPNAFHTEAIHGFERTLDDSSNRRLVLPESFLTADALLLTFQNILEGLRVNHAEIARHVDHEMPFLVLEAILMHMTLRGADRQVAHEKIRLLALKAHAIREQSGEYGSEMLQLLKEDCFFEPVWPFLNDLLLPERHIGLSPMQVEEFCSRQLFPIIQPYKSKLLSPSILESIRVEIEMSKTKMTVTSQADILCADCSAPGPSWASVNRGVFICTECCSVHRTLGRHFSQVRSLSKSYWHSHQLELVKTLHANGANNIWEHHLLNPLTGASASKVSRKPKPKDPLYPVKAEFIRAKYQDLAFSLRRSKDETMPMDLQLDDLNRQLNSCVRTNHVETTLRLLVLGADPSGFMDPDSGATPVHVAAREGQSLQVELLFLYGADPAQPNFDGQTPSALAEAAGHAELARRLEELEYEATDRLSFYLCGRMPDHQTGMHFLIPEVATGQLEQNRAVKLRLQRLTDRALEKLVQDVYDETDRRETDSAAACAKMDQSSERYVVPFLPVNADLAAPRNQRRQKLAKFNGREFTGLQIMLLNECKRRLQNRPDVALSDPTSGSEGKKLECEPLLSVTSVPNSADGPVYDEVPLESAEMLADVQAGGGADDFRTLRRCLATMNRKFDELSLQNKLFQAEILYLKKSYEQLSEELKSLKTTEQCYSAESNVPFTTGRMGPAASRGFEPLNSGQLSTTAGGHHYYWRHRQTAPKATSRSASMFLGDRTTALNGRLAGMLTTAHRSSLELPVGTTTASSVAVCGAGASGTLGVEEGGGDNDDDDGQFPSNLVFLTESLTKEIHHILAAAQAQQHHRFAPLVVRVQSIVDNMVNSVPPRLRKGTMAQSLDAIVDACLMLTVHCAGSPGEQDPTEEQFSMNIVKASYEVAKAAKQLMVSMLCVEISRKFQPFQYALYVISVSQSSCACAGRLIVSHSVRAMSESANSTEMKNDSSAEDLTPDHDGGVMKEIIKHGVGSFHPSKGNMVFVHYVGTLTDGTKFDSSRDRGKEFSFNVGREQVIKAWDIAVPTMKQGEICKITCSPKYAYGEAGAPPKIPENATLIFEIELLRWEGEDISPSRNKTILRSVQVAGEKRGMPKDESVVDIHIVGIYKGQLFLEKDISYTLGECEDQDLPSGVDEALRHFSKGEKSMVTLKENWGYGASGMPAFNIPPNADVEFMITLNSFTTVKEAWSMSDAEMLEHAENLKEKGSAFLKDGKVKMAIHKYNLVKNMLEQNTAVEEDALKEKRMNLIKAVFLNLALAYLKEDDNLQALHSCNKVLTHDPSNVKALYRRGQAHQNRRDYEDAMADFEKVISLEPKNAAALANIAFCKKQLQNERQRQRNLYANMLSISKA
ncbi:Adenylosuccinate lyase [Trichinella nativa]|uniref:peptidylprolyl isomerase n=1 Tax=Trichinella nativa TaxID=6335 RepID=A0A0V1KSR7_9BILA|nr:Adenylosuccinate lyase [Trichinella nativa]